MDAIDASLVDFGVTPLRTVACSATPYESDLKRRIGALIDAPFAVSLDELGQLDVAIGHAFAAAALALLHSAGVSPNAVTAIGSHGQTVRHRPDLALPFTLQIGDPSTLTELTGITVVGDFRRRDVAAGGQGAPLLPVFHDQVFRDDGEDRAIVNLGGIGNVTILRGAGPVTGFDTGPGNRLLDAWISEHRGLDYDADGAWAATGSCDGALLAELLNDPYFALPPPKSTGRELFNMPWLRDKLGAIARRPADVQATLLEFTAHSVALAVRAYAPGATVYVCGGGARNRRLLEAMGRLLAPGKVDSTTALGMDPDFVESIAFAWFAQRTLAGITSSAASVTGARGPRILGGIYRHA
jgi:anhydro-N-acetylmuramic acid kinase